MFALGDRVPFRSEVLAFCFFAGLFVARLDPASPTQQMPASDEVEVIDGSNGGSMVPAPDDPLKLAAAAYRAKDFDVAAQIIRDAHAASDLAELYGQLARAWAIGMDPSSAPIDAYPALREAWKLDTVLGGAFTDELYARLVEIAPQAALAFDAAKDYTAAKQALNTAQVLGVDSADTRRAAKLLARH